MRPATLERGGAKDGIEATIGPFTEATIGRRVRCEDTQGTDDVGRDNEWEGGI